MAMLAERSRISHRKARALLKKEKRRRRRQEEAKQRQAELANEEDVEEVENLEEEESVLEAERQRLHVEWLAKEQQAQEEFRLKKEKEETARKKQEEEERRIREEWEQQQMKEKEEVEHKQQERREREIARRGVVLYHEFADLRQLAIHLRLIWMELREEAVQKMLDQAENQFENGGTWHNPEAPEDYGTEKDKSYCPFFLKTGSCRFGDRCSRKHVYPASSQTLLIRAMFITFGMEESRRDDYDTDSGLEHSEEDIYQQFVEFYEDVLPEFKSIGKVIQFKVSCNYEPHLRGNVYVQYQKEEECQQAFVLFNGRWYAGKQLQCEFSPVSRWKTAICGLYERRKCPRGKHCNFLHVFRNPNNEFWEADRDLYVSPDRTKSYSSKYFERRERMSYRHDYHGRSRRRYSCSPDKTHRRSGESERKRKRSRSRERRRLQRSRSKSQDRKRSRSRERYRRSQSKERRKSQRSRSRSEEKRRSRSRDGSRCRSRSRSEERSLSRSKSRSRSRSKRRSRDRSGSRGLGTERSRSRSRSPLGWNRKKKRESENKDKKSKKRAKKEKKAKSKADGKSKGSKAKRQDDEHRNSPVSPVEKDAQVPAHSPEARGLSTSPSVKSSASDFTVPAKVEETAETESVNQ